MFVLLASPFEISCEICLLVLTRKPFSFHTRRHRPKYHYPQVVSIPVGVFVCVIHFGSALTIPTAIFKRTLSGGVLIVTSIYA